MKQFYRHYLPHWQPPGATIFITYRLFDSLPKEVILRLAEEKQRLQKEPARAGESRRDRALREGKRIFALTDNALDAGLVGPKWLTRDDVAAIIAENLFHHIGRLYRLWAFVVMSNHVHILVEPLMSQTHPDGGDDDTHFVALERITHALKSFTAKRANRVLNRSGNFWQEESFDHWARDEREFERIVTYIENNPVRAGLVDSPEKWKWSSAAFERGEDGACVNCRASGSLAAG
jgi:REP element-mobilizing transposase RayT